MANTPYAFPRLSPLDLAIFVGNALVAVVQTTPFIYLVEAVVLLSIHLTIGLPLDIVRGRRRQKDVHAYRHRSTVLQDAINSTVRLAFGYLDYRIARAFFSRPASEAFVRHRIGKKTFDCCVQRVENKQTTGWLIGDEDEAPTLAKGIGARKDRTMIMYIHGGGFVLGSPTFYLEFLTRLRCQLSKANPSLQNCVIYAPEYPLAPEHAYPAQAIAVENAWQWLAAYPAADKTRLIVAGDSAGAGLCVGLLHAIAKGTVELARAKQAILISPWTNLKLDVDSQTNVLKNATADFVEPFALTHYADKLVNGTSAETRAPGIVNYLHHSLLSISPSMKRRYLKHKTRIDGQFKLPARPSMPSRGILVLFGKQEVMADQARSLASKREDQVTLWSKQGAVHAWPISQLYLGRDEKERAEGILAIVSFMVKGV